MISFTSQDSKKNLSTNSSTEEYREITDISLTLILSILLLVVLKKFPWCILNPLTTDL